MRRRIAEACTLLLLLSRDRLRDTVKAALGNVFDVTQQTFLEGMAGRRFGYRTARKDEAVSLAVTSWRDHVLAGLLPSPYGLLSAAWREIHGGHERLSRLAQQEDKEYQARLTESEVAEPDPDSLRFGWPTWLEALFRASWRHCGDWSGRCRNSRRRRLAMRGRSCVPRCSPREARAAW